MVGYVDSTGSCTCIFTRDDHWPYLTMARTTPDRWKIMGRSWEDHWKEVNHLETPSHNSCQRASPCASGHCLHLNHGGARLLHRASLCQLETDIAIQQLLTKFRCFLCAPQWRKIVLSTTDSTGQEMSRIDRTDAGSALHTALSDCTWHHA